MKNIIKILFLCGIIVFIGFSCEDKDTQDEVYLELYIDSEETAIVKTIENIEFKFCLLNELGMPTTSFNEGENFSFYFSIKNISSDSLYNDPSFLCKDNGFCKVYNEQSAIIGMPFIFKGTDLIGTAAYPLYGVSSKYELIIPWQDNRDEWQTLHCYFESTNMDLLSKGTYYTSFVHQFSFDKANDTSTIRTKVINFKINFEII